MSEHERVGDLSKDELVKVIDKHTLSADEMRAIVKEAVHETLVQLGVDTSSPLEMQRDFQHLRDWRMAQETIRRKGYLTMMSIFVTGVLGLLWIGFKDFFINLVR